MGGRIYGQEHNSPALLPYQYSADSGFICHHQVDDGITKMAVLLPQIFGLLVSIQWEEVVRRHLILFLNSQ